MVGMNLKFTKDFARLDKLIANEFTPVALSTVTDFAVEYMHDHWSSTSPSSPGKPPAVVSGALDESIYAEGSGRDAGGRFASKGAVQSQFIQIASEYAAALEFGYPPRNLAPRPFLVPALMAAAEEFPGAFKYAIGFK